MARARDLGTPADWLLRSQHNRALPDGDKLWASVLATEPLGDIRFLEFGRAEEIIATGYEYAQKQLAGLSLSRQLGRRG